MAKKKARKKTAGRKATRKKTAKKKASKRARGGSLRGLSTEALHAELRRRQSSTKTLERKRERLLEQLQSVESELASMGVPITSAGGTRKRFKNDLNLEDALAKMLRNRTMGVTEAAENVQREGYMTSSPNFRTIVNQTLLRSKKIKKVTRGQYTAR